MRCPHCGGTVKAHFYGRRDFRQLTRRQRQASIAAYSRWIRELRRVHRELCNRGR